MTTIRNIRKSFALLWEVSPLLVMLQFGLLVITGLLPVCTTLLIKIIIDNLQGISLRGTAGSSNPELPNHLIFLALAMVGVLLLISILGGVQELVQEILSKQLSFKISGKTILKAMNLDLIFFETPQFYDQLIRAQNEANMRPYGIVNGLFTIFNSMLTVVGLLLLLFTFSPGIALALIALAVPLLVVQSYFSHQLYALNKSQTTGQREMFYFSYLLTNTQSIKEIKLFGLGDYLFGIYSHVFNVQFRESLHLSARRLVGSTATHIIGLLGYGGALIYMMLQTASGALSLGSLAAYFGALMQLQSQIANLANNITLLYENTLYLDNLFSFLELQPLVKAANAPQTQPSELNHTDPGGYSASAQAALEAAPERSHRLWTKASNAGSGHNPASDLQVHLPFQQGYVLKDVSFRYPSNPDKLALTQINLEIKPGETLALVGENGAGKSTIVKLLCRLYEPSGGEISLDGKALHDYDLDNLRQHIGVIFQDYTKYWLTARENIGFGDLLKLGDILKIREAASKSGADEVIQRLTEGYNTRLGVMWEGSDQLSEGQWQRIALARAYLRNAPILILDEPTASLDAKVEYETFQRFRELTVGKIAILISHRFNNVRMADRIAVLECGEIVEQGTHDELLALNGRYAALFQRQAAGYQ